MFINLFNRFKGPLVRSILHQNYFFAGREVAKFDPSKDYYQILQINRQSSDLQIKKAYYKLAKSYHPDAHLGKQLKFKQVTEAYFVLSHPDIKKEYFQARLKRSTKAPLNNRTPQQHSNSKVQKRKLTPQEARNLLIFFVVFIIIMIIGQQEQNDASRHKREGIKDIQDVSEYNRNNNIVLAQETNQQYVDYLPYEYQTSQDTNLLLSAQSDQVFLLPDYSNSETK